MKRNKHIFDTLQRQDKRVPSAVIDSLATEEIQEADNSVEARIRKIIREELGGLCATIDEDPLVHAMETIEKLEVATSRPNVNIQEVKKYVNRLKSLLPDISEEMEIIRDTLVGV